MHKVKTGLRGKNVFEKLAFADRLANRLKSNITLTGSEEHLGELERAVKALEKAIEMAAYGDRRAINARKLCEDQVEMAIKNLALTVDRESMKDEGIIELVGFEKRRRNNRPQKLTPPDELTLQRTDNEKEICVKWSGVKNSRSYIVEVKSRETKDGQVWKSDGFTTRRKFTLSGLTPGRRYWVRVRAVGALGVSKPSEIKQIMAA
ncbi:MAG: fibronectin type III domain-containing protein [Flavobacteriales bacterium]|nr:fibronectin type III domain-containing protein [Flavobacteriales bacterium]